MYNWPVPDSYNKELPEKGNTGSFWEKRDGLFNCGIHIYAPEGSEVLTVDEGRVISINHFTNHEISPILGNTRYVIIKTNNVFVKYGGLKDIFVEPGSIVTPGQKIGSIGSILNGRTNLNLEEEVLYSSLEKGGRNYLHLEILKPPVHELKPYFVGFFMIGQKPFSLIDPLLFFKYLS